MNSEAPESCYQGSIHPDSDKPLDTTSRNEERRRSNVTGTDDKFFEHTCGSTIPSRGIISQSEEHEASPSKVSRLRDRIRCYTWTWFTMTMATGGVANVLYSTPFKSDWLRIVGTVVFLFNIALFLMNTVFLTLKFWWAPGSFKRSFISNSESLFISACVVSTGTILINTCQYGIPLCGEWLQTTMQICFWAYLCVAVIASSSIYLIIWSTHSFPIQTMTPIWIFPAYPLLLLAPLASNLIDALPTAASAERINSVAIALAAVCIQGTGFMLSLMIYSAFVYRLMTQKLPQETRRPGMFVSVGPSGFTVAGIVHLGNIMESKILPSGLQSDPRVSFTLKLLASLTGLWLWGLCLWFFIVSVGAHWRILTNRERKDPDRRIRFDMTWYSFVFPNTAMVTASHAIAKAFNSDAIKVLSTVASGFLVMVWIIVFGSMIRAFWERRLLWPDEMALAEVLEKRKRSGAQGEV